MAMVDVRRVTKVYRRDAEELVVLNGLSLQVEEGEFVAVVGPNGAGKSTLCYALAGFVPHFFKGELTGAVVVDGRDLHKSTLSEWVLTVPSESSSSSTNPSFLIPAPQPPLNSG